MSEWIMLGVLLVGMKVGTKLMTNLQAHFHFQLEALILVP